MKSKIAAFRQQGVLGVDMETSAMYALGKFRGVQVCNLLVISDEVHSEWKPAFGKEPVVQGTLLACDAVLQVLKSKGM
jgi:purine-nucleoside phosphorylase